MDKEKRERSIPVQGRVDLVELADIAVVLSRKGFEVSSMSKLINLCVQMAHWALENTEEVMMRHEGVSDAHRTMVEAGLYQRSMYKVGRKKLLTAMAFENLRKEGVDPITYVPHQANVLHNRHSIDYPNVRESKKEQMRRVYDKVMAEKMASKESKGLTMEKFEELKNKDYDEEVARKKLEEGYRLRAEAMKRRLEEEEREGRNRLIEEMEEIVESSKVKSDVPAQKNTEEMARDEERIARKDQALLEAMDSCSLPTDD